MIFSVNYSSNSYYYHFYHQYYFTITKLCSFVEQVSRKCLVTKEGSVSSLVNELKTEVRFLAEHLFRADWQHAQFTRMRALEPFPANTALMVLDFAENFSCSYQDKVQAAHWHHQQVTLHPSVW